MEAKGFDTETMTWRKPEAPAPVQPPVLAMEAMSDEAFQQLLAARDEYRATGRNILEPGISDVQFVREAMGTWGRGESEAEPEPDGSESWGRDWFMGELVD
jgi:hypothetical protein